jgi:hypothetical protein
MGRLPQVCLRLNRSFQDDHALLDPTSIEAVPQAAVVLIVCNSKVTVFPSTAIIADQIGTFNLQLSLAVDVFRATRPQQLGRSGGVVGNRCNTSAR